MARKMDRFMFTKGVTQQKKVGRQWANSGPSSPPFLVLNNLASQELVI
jgi:hypothetical protein